MAASYQGSVAASFATTVRALRADPQLQIQADRWPGVRDTAAAVLCYIDGTIPKAPPPGPGDLHPRPFDRAVIAVIGGQADFLLAGYRDQVPIEAP